jgi:catechol 2,3-dioxygenase-like lactoylglutathione lyase family enzyme
MAVELNHTIVHAKDKRESAEFLADILGLAPPKPFVHFLVVKLANGVSLDFIDDPGELRTTHYAFLVSEDEFNEIFARIKARGLTWWADPGRTQPGRVNRRDGGRGLYFLDPAGHILEIITRPYGGV